MIVSESEHSADMLYATGFRAPDSFVWLEAGGRTSVLLSDLEIDRGRREARVDEVVSVSEIGKSLLKNRAGKKSGIKPSPTEVIAAFLKKRGGSRPLVPADFPLGLARELEVHGVRVTPAEGMLQPEREIKSPSEVLLLGKALRITEAGMARALEVLRSASVGPGNVLLWGGGKLTAERLRTEIEAAILRAGGIPGGNTIVACGEQACDPHERGHGPLRAGKLLILDIFPRATNGYFGDMTRTVVRGRATPEQRRLWETCLKGQELALRALRPGAVGGEIHEAVTDFFREEGYPTRRVGGKGGKSPRWSGFFHGTGHGLGMDLHESPRFGAATLRAGNVFTIEPGLYIPGLGGVRHEDVALITPRGHRLLSRFPKPFEI
jgi:Xaa-Pro aminopeptidase